MLQRTKSRISLGVFALIFTLNCSAALAADDQLALTTDRDARQTEQQARDAKAKDLCGRNGPRNEYCRSARVQAKSYAQETTGLETLMVRLERIEQRLTALESKMNTAK